jgi:hypothetical protein
MAFEGAILIAIVAWWVSGHAVGETGWWPPALVALGAGMTFAPAVTMLSELHRGAAARILGYGFAHLAIVAAIAAVGLYRVPGTAYGYLLVWCAYAAAANAALWCLLALVAVLRPPRV